jgi:hypothetical protein
MRTALRRLYPLFLLGLCILAYGLWINRLGFYWDDFPLAWIARTYGGDGLARYFSTNRPFWGLLYRLTTPLLGTGNPLVWQVFAIFWRWVSGLLLWQLVRLTWPRHEETGRWAAALVVLYPGFSEQFISLVFGHFILVLCLFLGSQVLMVLAVRRERLSLGLLAASWLVSAANLFTMEYHFLPDLIRPLLLWYALSEASPAFRAAGLPGRIRRILLIWAPYLALMAAAVVWRTFILGFHTYQPTFTAALRADPLSALGGLLARIAGDLWLTAGQAWGLAFDFAGLSGLTARQVQIFWAVAAAGALFALAYWLLSAPKTDPATGIAAQKPRRSDWVGFFLVAGAALILAGGPFWLTGLPVTLAFTTDRFTISFMSGAALLAAGLLALLPLPRWVKIVPLAVTLGLCAGLQFRNSLVYSKDWSTQKTLFWQMAWRIPALEPGTILLFNELPVVHYSDNSLTAPLNWIYAPDNHSTEMSYVLYYPTVRLGAGLPRLEKGLPVVQDYLAAEFRGDTSKVVVLYYQPPGCVRVMDPEVEADIWVVPEYLRQTLKLASTAPILPEGQPNLPPRLFGGEPQRGWCYYFEKADLARQQRDWTAAANLGDQAFALNDYPNDPVERFPFIEAYAQTGQWQRALDLTRQTRDIAPLYARLACRLWARIEREVPAEGQKDATLAQARQILGCAGP